MEKDIAFLRGKKIRVTPQRLQVYKILKAGHRHMTADEIYGKVKTTSPIFSRATVYTILQLFRTKDIVKELRIEAERSCFDARADIHHHFLCTQCRMVFDIDIPLCPTSKKGSIQGHSIEDFHGFFYGVCKDCKGKKRKALPGKAVP